MSSIRTMKPVKLFIGVLAMKDWSLEERLEERLISEFGVSDHRLSLIPSEEAIHRVLISFDRLTANESLEEIRKISRSIEEEFSAKLDVGFLDNRRVALASGTVEDVIQYRDFFLAMRKTYRSQLRTMCLLRR